MKNIDQKARENIKDILNICIKHDSKRKAVVVYDTDFGLTQIVTDGYRSALTENVEFIDWSTKTREEIISLFNSLSKDDLVVLI